MFFYRAFLEAPPSICCVCSFSQNPIRWQPTLRCKEGWEIKFVLFVFLSIAFPTKSPSYYEAGAGGYSVDSQYCLRHPAPVLTVLYNLVHEPWFQRTLDQCAKLFSIYPFNTFMCPKYIQSWYVFHRPHLSPNPLLLCFHLSEHRHCSSSNERHMCRPCLFLSLHLRSVTSLCLCLSFTWSQLSSSLSPSSVWKT